MTPSVSIVIPFLDAERFLEHAIESVCRQSLADWELLLVDDGSSDSSTALAKSYSARNGKIRYLEHPQHRNRGISASRNLGIDHAAGEFVAFLDADDAWHVEKLERQTSLLRARPDVGLAFNRAIYVYESGQRRLQPLSLSPGRLGRWEWVARMLANEEDAACPSGTIVRRSVARFLGGFDGGFGGVYEDQMMWCRASLHTGVYYDADPVVTCNVHAASYCGSTSASERVRTRVAFYHWLLDHLEDHGAPRLLELMVRSRLAEALARVQISRSIANPRLGPVFSKVVALGDVSHLLSSAASRIIFHACHVLLARGGT